jgi:hypothetical protein
MHEAQTPLLLKEGWRISAGVVLNEPRSAPIYRVNQERFAIIYKVASHL